MKVNDRCHHSVINYHSVLFTLDGSLTSLVVSPDQSVLYTIDGSLTSLVVPPGGFVATCTCSNLDMIMPDEMGLYSNLVELICVMINNLVIEIKSAERNCIPCTCYYGIK